MLHCHATSPKSPHVFPPGFIILPECCYHMNSTWYHHNLTKFPFLSLLHQNLEFTLATLPQWILWNTATKCTARSFAMMSKSHDEGEASTMDLHVQQWPALQWDPLLPSQEVWRLLWVPMYGHMQRAKKEAWDHSDITASIPQPYLEFNSIDFFMENVFVSKMPTSG